MKQQQELTIISLVSHRPVFFPHFFTGLVYYPSLHYEFQFDDLRNITKHLICRHYALSDSYFSQGLDGLVIGLIQFIIK